MSHGIAAVAAGPAILLAMGQAKGSGGMAWIEPLWHGWAPVLAIPRSLCVLGLGGNVPFYLMMVASPVWVGVVAAGLMVAALAASLWPARKFAAGEDGEGGRELGRFGWLFWTFALWPLGVMWAYSMLRTPIYVVGRYDMLAQPAYLALLAAGFSRLQGMAPERVRGMARVGLPAVVLLVMGWGAADRLMAPDRLVEPVHRWREEYLSMVGEPGDLIVCTGLETTQTLYYLQRDHRGNGVVTFPRETMSHVGWIATEEELRCAACGVAGGGEWDFWGGGAEEGDAGVDLCGPGVRGGDGVVSVGDADVAAGCGDGAWGWHPIFSGCGSPGGGGAVACDWV